MSTLSPNLLDPSNIQEVLVGLDRFESPNQLSPVDHHHLVNSSPNRLTRHHANTTSTPALEALRSRIKRSKPNLVKSLEKLASSHHPSTFPLSSNQPPPSGIHPNSSFEFLRRLETFKLSNYPSGKPRILSPPSMAALGWTCAQKNRLKCITCASSWVLSTPSRGDWSSASGTQIAELGRRMSSEQHRPSCPWRSRRTPSSVYHAPRSKSGKEATLRLLKIAESLLDSILHNGQPLFRLEHPLSETEVTVLSTAVGTLHNTISLAQSNPSTLCDGLILALFGWTCKQSLRSLTTRSSPSLPPSLSSSMFGQTSIDANQSSPIITITCELCHRQVLRPHAIRTFNVMTEHRDHCPFVDPYCGFDQSPNKLAWKTQLDQIQNYQDRLNSKPTSLENVIECFITQDLSVNQTNPQLSALSLVKAALNPQI